MVSRLTFLEVMWWASAQESCPSLFPSPGEQCVLFLAVNIVFHLLHKKQNQKQRDQPVQTLPVGDAHELSVLAAHDTACMRINVFKNALALISKARISQDEIIITQIY